jgi:hypothetical protein
MLQILKVAQGCSKGKKLLKTQKVAHKLPSTIYKGLTRVIDNPHLSIGIHIVMKIFCSHNPLIISLSPKDLATHNDTTFAKFKHVYCDRSKYIPMKPKEVTKLSPEYIRELFNNKKTTLLRSRPY